MDYGLTGSSGPFLSPLLYRLFRLVRLVGDRRLRNGYHGAEEFVEPLKLIFLGHRDVELHSLTGHLPLILLSVCRIGKEWSERYDIACIEIAVHRPGDVPILSKTYRSRTYVCDETLHSIAALFRIADR